MLRKVFFSLRRVLSGAALAKEGMKIVVHLARRRVLGWERLVDVISEVHPSSVELVRADYCMGVPVAFLTRLNSNRYPSHAAVTRVFSRTGHPAVPGAFPAPQSVRR
jgi:hypothetical protein